MLSVSHSAQSSHASATSTPGLCLSAGPSHTFAGDSQQNRLNFSSLMCPKIVVCCLFDCSSAVYHSVASAMGWGAQRDCMALATWA